MADESIPELSPEVRKVRDRKYSARYRAKNRAKRRLALQRWRTENPEKVRAQQQRASQKRRGKRPQLRAAFQKWRRNNPDKVRERDARRRARKAAAPINNFTAKQWRALCKAAGYRCAYCHKKFPFKQLTQDHIIPLSKGGSHTLANIVPACLSCNSRKKDRDVLTPVQPFLLLPEEDAAAD